MAEEIQGFAGFDADKMRDAVGAVLGSKDDVAAAVSFFREHGDDMVDLVRRLPELLASTSGALTAASDDVGNAAAFLTGGRKSGPGVKALAGSAGEALDACREELGSAKSLLDKVGDLFEDLPIPDGGIGSRVSQAATRFDTVGDKLAEVASQLRDMGEALDKAGHGLARTAVKLEDGGKALGTFSS